MPATVTQYKAIYTTKSREQPMNKQNVNNTNDKTTAIRAELAKLKLQLAKQTKANELYKNTLKDFTKKANALSKEKLDEVYDPADPSSVQKAIDEHNTKLQEQLDNLFTQIDKQAEDYTNKTFKSTNLELADKLAIFNEANNTNLTPEQLEDEIPPKLHKQFKDDEEGLYKAAAEYLAKVNGDNNSPNKPTTPYTPQTPNTPDGNPATNQPQELPDEGDDGDEMY